MQNATSLTSTVPLDELGLKLSSLRLCQPTYEEAMRRSLQQHGQLTAVTAFRDGEALQLIDGFKRVRAGRQLGWTRLLVRTHAFDAATATGIIAVAHEHRGLSELEEGWLVRSLHREHGLTQGAVARLLRRHKSWVSRRLLLVEGLDDAVQGDVRLGLLSPRSALALAALPRGNQQEAAELVVRRGMTTRQAEGLVRRLSELESNEARAAALAGWPQVTSSSSVKTRPRSQDEQLLAEVATMMRVGVRLEVLLLKAPCSPSRSDVVRKALSDLAAVIGILNQAIKRAMALQDKIDATLAKP